MSVNLCQFDAFQGAVDFSREYKNSLLPKTHILGIGNTEFGGI